MASAPVVFVLSPQPRRQALAKRGTYIGRALAWGKLGCPDGVTQTLISALVG